MDDLLDGREVVEECWQGTTQGKGGQLAATPILHGTGVPLVLGGSGRTQDETAWITAPSQRVHLLEDGASGQAEARVITLQNLARWVAAAAVQRFPVALEKFGYNL